MQHRTRVVAGLALALVLGQLSVAPMTSSAACLLCGPSSSPTPTPTQSPTHAASAAPTATPTPTPTPTTTTTTTASPSPSVSPTSTTPATISGPDVASYQHPATAQYPNGKPINWTAVARAGMSFGIVKASESTTYTNPFFSADYAGVAAAGLVRGSYHFARPAYPVQQTAMAQAAYFANLIGQVNTPATLPPVLDLEVTGGLPRADLVTWAQTFLYRMRTLTGRTPMLYTYPSFWTDVLADPTAFSRFPIWMASYGSSAPSSVELWQYTDSAAIPGISGHVDESKFLGTGGLPWTTLSDGTVKVPWTPAAPKPPHSLAVVAGPTTATVSWVPGNDGSARTTSYVVTSSPGNISATVDGSTTSATVTGLDPDTSYTFTVTATNSAGTSVPSSPTSAVTPIVATQLALTQPASINFGRPLLVTAVLTRTDTNAGVAGQTIVILRRDTGQTKWLRQGTATTASDGSISVRLHPSRGIDVRLAFKGSPGYEPDYAGGSTVVHAVVSAALSRTTVRHGHYVKITGTVSPVIAGEQAVRQQLIGTTWQNGPTRTIDKDGAFTFRLHPKRKKTTLTYRIFIAAGNGLGAGASPVLILTVR